MTHLAGIDIGGTFTDCVIVSADGGLELLKVPSTPDDFSAGFYAALEAAANRLGVSIEALLADTEAIAHGTTVATNAMVTRRGAKVGFLTTAGHRDVLPMMRAYGRVAGLPPGELLHYSQTGKPEPLVPKALIEEVPERIDRDGNIVAALDEGAAGEAIDRLLAAGVEAIGIGLLWGFKNPVHERRLAELVAERDPGCFVSLAGELAPRIGEYERLATAAVNAYVGPVTKRYLDAIRERLGGVGFTREVNLMQCSGGVTTAAEAGEAPVHLLGSGPAGGVIASKLLGDELGIDGIVATDMGGTTLDAGLIVGGEPVSTSTNVVDQYEFYVPTIEIRSIGAGGGSIARFDEHSRSLRVGPQSAGAMPGPICYGRGGTEPTVTDADLVLGYLDPEDFAEGTMTLDIEAATAALAELGKPLGLDAVQTASGVTQIIDFQMADLLRKMTIERGSDPRDLTVFAYGGAGPLHGGVYARELGAKRMIVPLADAASVWSALGVASSDVLRIKEVSEIMPSPWDPRRLGEAFAALERAAVAALEAEGFPREKIVLQRVADVRYSLQVHVVEVPVPGGEIDAAGVAALEREFSARYEGLFGKGTGFADAGMEIVAMRVRATGLTPGAPLRRREPGASEPSDSARKGRRAVYWHELGEAVDTDIFAGPELVAGNAVAGPAILEYADTTVVVRPGQKAKIDAYGNVEVEL